MTFGDYLRQDRIDKQEARPVVIGKEVTLRKTPQHVQADCGTAFPENGDRFQIPLCSDNSECECRGTYRVYHPEEDGSILACHHHKEDVIEMIEDDL